MLALAKRRTCSSIRRRRPPLRRSSGDRQRDAEEALSARPVRASREDDGARPVRITVSADASEGVARPGRCVQMYAGPRRLARPPGPIAAKRLDHEIASSLVDWDDISRGKSPAASEEGDPRQVARWRASNMPGVEIRLQMPVAARPTVGVPGHQPRSANRQCSSPWRARGSRHRRLFASGVLQKARCPGTRRSRSPSRSCRGRRSRHAVSRAQTPAWSKKPRGGLPLPLDCSDS